MAKLSHLWFLQFIYWHLNNYVALPTITSRSLHNKTALTLHLYLCILISGSSFSHCSLSPFSWTWFCHLEMPGSHSASPLSFLKPLQNHRPLLWSDFSQWHCLNPKNPLFPSLTFTKIKTLGISTLYFLCCYFWTALWVQCVCIESMLQGSLMLMIY